MDLHRNNNYLVSNTSPSSSSSTASTTPHPAAGAASGASDDPMHSWWESISKARSRIHALSTVLPPSDSLSLFSLADSDRPALSLLSSQETYSAVSSAFSAALSGSGSDPLCQWLYDTYLTSDHQLRLVVLSYLPVLTGLYLTRIHSDPSPSLAGFEAVLLAIYSAEVKARSGKPITISIVDLSQPSLYHTPRNKPQSLGPNRSSQPSVGVLCPPLEPQLAVKSTKRATIVGIALDCYYRQISQMPAWSKLDLCRFTAAWAGQDCPCRREFDNDNETEDESQSIADLQHEIEHDAEDVVEEFGHLKIYENGGSENLKGARIPLPWELLQPVLRILGHCLLAPLNSQEVKDAASIAVRSLYGRASHELIPQAILATRSLIQLDKRARADSKAAEAATASGNASSNTNTPTKAKKPEILLVSK
ncbi:uncharacterized protein LOC116197312 [Punica granatum]|uniref:Hyccin n=2 Tax=Punica granatum TaxID=22663 RepID=A0A218VU93_PUNGR|nr:uncharacterized protein LOC116197312 [Punica granatum]OWM63591.1 hypothetical protein CDL15_Pgr008134 [Punica granatum]PKI37831.1 hypothetical protein CRG98_041781 [Punica granatum]